MEKIIKLTKKENSTTDIKINKEVELHNWYHQTSLPLFTHEVPKVAKKNSNNKTENIFLLGITRISNYYYFDITGCNCI